MRKMTLPGEEASFPVSEAGGCAVAVVFVVSDHSPKRASKRVQEALEHMLLGPFGRYFIHHPDIVDSVRLYKEEGGQCLMYADNLKGLVIPLKGKRRRTRR